MKNVFASFTVLILFILMCGSLASCSLDRAGGTDSDMDTQENISGSEQEYHMNTEEIVTDHTKLIAPPLDYHYSQADENYIYYIYYDEIYRWNQETGEEQSIYKGSGLLHCMEKYRDYLYFVEESDEKGEYKLCSICADGQDFTLISQISTDCLGLTDNYLFVRKISGDGKITDEVYELDGGDAWKLETDLIDYTYAEAADVYTNEENTAIIKDGETLFRTPEGEYVNLKAYSDKYVFADILDENMGRKQLLFCDLEQDISMVYDNREPLNIEIHDDWAVFYLYGEVLDVNIVDLRDANEVTTPIS